MVEQILVPTENHRPLESEPTNQKGSNLDGKRCCVFKNTRSQRPSEIHGLFIDNWLTIYNPGSLFVLDRGGQW